MKVLFRLLEGYGVGDLVQFSVVLKHLRKYRPHWIIDYQCKTGCASLMANLCHRVFTDSSPVDERNYDRIVEVNPVDNWSNFTDRPNTKITAALHENFGIPYDPSLGRYEVSISDRVRVKAKRLIGDERYVALHYQGASSPHRKDLEDWQAEAICHSIRQTGCKPLLIDRAKKSPVEAVRLDDSIKDLEEQAAVISLCKAFIGIDSGPAHLASATDTPTLVCWTKNHPVQFHDPAPNTTHLVPVDHRDIYPADNEAIAEYFERTYLWTTYYGSNGLVASVARWLASVFRCDVPDSGVRFVVPADRRAVAWVVAKIRNVAQGRPIDVIVAEDWRTGSAHYEMNFLKRFPFIRSVRVADMPIHVGPEKPKNTRGHYLYIPDGWRDGYFYLVPNATMQLGLSLAEWMPQVPIDVEALEQLKELGCEC